MRLLKSVCLTTRMILKNISNLIGQLMKEITKVDEEINVIHGKVGGGGVTFLQFINIYSKSLG